MSLLAEMKPVVVVSFIWTGLEGVTGAEGGTLREKRRAGVQVLRRESSSKVTRNGGFG